MFVWLSAVVAGLASAVQGHLMGVLDQTVGSRESVLITYGVGGLLIFVTMLPRILAPEFWASIQKVPWYTFLSGVLGLVIVGAIGYSVPRMGMAKAFTVIVAAQLVAAVLFDQFGLMGAAMKTLTTPRLAGVVLMVVSVWLVLY